MVWLLQLLKAIFGTNLAGQWESHMAAVALRPPVSRATARSSAAVRPGIYHVCLNQPYIQLKQAMASTTMKTSGTAASVTSVEHDDSTRSDFPCQWLYCSVSNTLITPYRSIFQFLQLLGLHHMQMHRGNVFSHVSLYVCLSHLGHWEPWARKFIFDILRMSRSVSYVKVIGSRSRSQGQNACLYVLFAGGLPSTERQHFCSSLLSYCAWTQHLQCCTKQIEPTNDGGSIPSSIK